MFELVHTENGASPAVRFADKRLSYRYDKLMRMLEEGQSSVINKISLSRRERKGAYDFFKNPRISETELKEKLYEQVILRPRDEQADEHILVIGDTTEYNYLPNGTHLRDTSGLGTLSNESSLGYCAHLSLALRAKDQAILGITDLQLWHRPAKRAGAKTRKQRAFEHKESYKWHVGVWNRAADRTHHRLPNRPITYIQDRDGDVYESILKVKALPQAELLVRSCRDRKILLPDGSQRMLYGYLAEQKPSYTYEFLLKADAKTARKARLATMQVYASRVKLVRPANLSRKHYPPFVEVDVVWAKEHPASVPPGGEPVDWKLITTHPAAGSKTLMADIISWYTRRWLIAAAALKNFFSHQVSRL